MKLRFATIPKFVVEKGVNALELEVAVLESETLDPKQLIVSVAGEISPTSQHEFYSYTSKYLDENGAEYFIPARISPALQEKAQAIAKQIFIALECEGMARVDLFLERETNQIYFMKSIPFPVSPKSACILN